MFFLSMFLSYSRDDDVFPVSAQWKYKVNYSILILFAKARQKKKLGASGQAFLISPALVREILVTAGPISSYTKVPASTTARI